MTSLEPSRIFNSQQYTRPVAAVQENYPRHGASFVDIDILTSGELWLVACPMTQYTTIEAITFVSGANAAATPTHQWFALFHGFLGLLEVTDDDTTTAWPANTAKTLSFATPFEAGYSGLYYLGLVVTAATPPSLTGVVHATDAVNALPLGASGASDTGLTNPASCPGTASTFTTSDSVPYAYVGS